MKPVQIVFIYVKMFLSRPIVYYIKKFKYILLSSHTHTYINQFQNYYNSFYQIKNIHSKQKGFKNNNNNQSFH